MNCDATFVLRPGNDVVESDEAIGIGRSFRDNSLPGWSLSHLIVSLPLGAPFVPRRLSKLILVPFNVSDIWRIFPIIVDRCDWFSGHSRCLRDREAWPRILFASGSLTPRLIFPGRLAELLEFSPSYSGEGNDLH